jgi:hypothetical protein
MNLPRLIAIIVCISLAGVIIPMNAVLLIGLFDPLVDNNRVFAIIGPGYNTVIGIFGGILTGYALGKTERKP